MNQISVRHRAAVAIGLTLALLAPIGATPFGNSSAAIGATPALRVTVYCYSNPERTVVKNNRSTPVFVRSVGSIYKPYSDEPFPVALQIAARGTVTFYSGHGAKASNPRTLTRRYIYNNSVGTKEGARVITSKSVAYTDRC